MTDDNEENDNHFEDNQSDNSLQNTKRKLGLNPTYKLIALKSKFSIKFFIMIFCSLYLLYAFIFLFTNLYLSENRFYDDFYNGNYKKAIKNYNKIIKTNTLLGLKNTSYTFYAKFIIARSYFIYGDLNKSLNLFKELLYITQKYTPQDKKNISAIALYTALIYANLGYFQKADKYIELCEETDKLVFYYLSKQTYKINADKQLYKTEEKLLDLISQNIKTRDCVTFINKLGMYYIGTEQYNKAEFLYQKVLKESSDEQVQIFMKLFLAKLYQNMNNYTQAKNLYEDVLNHPFYSFENKIKTKNEYILLLKKFNDIQNIKIIEKEIQKDTDQYLFEISPIRICSKYYTLSILNQTEQPIVNKQINKLFKKLSLTKKSLFYNNIEEFCAINMERY